MTKTKDTIPWTVQQVKRGRRAALVILVIWAISTVAVFVIDPTFGIIPAIINFTLMYWLNYGHNWARNVSRFAMMLYAFAIAGHGTFFPDTSAVRVVFAVLAFLMFASACYLLFSKNIPAFLWYKREKKKLEDKKKLEELEAEFRRESQDDA